MFLKTKMSFDSKIRLLILKPGHDGTQYGTYWYISKKFIYELDDKREFYEFPVISKKIFTITNWSLAYD